MARRTDGKKLRNTLNDAEQDNLEPMHAWKYSVCTCPVKQRHFRRYVTATLSDYSPKALAKRRQRLDLIGQLMAEFVPFGCHVAGIVLVDWWHNRYLIDDLQIEPTINERIGFFRIVGQQPNALEAEILEQLNTNSIISRIRLERQLRAMIKA